jgi:ABC-type sugar transport system ATPase subunit
VVAVQEREKVIRANLDRLSEIMLARVHLTSSADAYPAKLSGGQQQRVAIARALVAQPLAIMMDEPLSNLDDELRDELCGQNLDLHARLGFTLVYVTHSMEEMRRIGARAIRLHEGKADSP